MYIFLKRKINEGIFNGKNNFYSSKKGTTTKMLRNKTPKCTMSRVKSNTLLFFLSFSLIYYLFITSFLINLTICTHKESFFIVVTKRKIIF